MSWISRHSESLRFRTVAGIVLLVANFDARKRRAPATNSYALPSPSGTGRTRIACQTPCNRMLSANSRSLVSSKTRRALVVNKTKLREFADNIRLHGVLQAILVRPVPD